MNYTKEELSNDIRARLEALDGEGRAWHTGWIAKAIMADYEGAIDKAHPNADFWTYCAHQFVKDETRQFANRLHSQKDYNDQLVLPGFERVYLQARYSVTRENEEVFVAIMDMTDEELEERAQMFERQSKTMLEHANEIRRFKLWREMRKVA